MDMKYNLSRFAEKENLPTVSNSGYKRKSSSFTIDAILGNKKNEDSGFFDNSDCLRNSSPVLTKLHERIQPNVNYYGNSGLNHVSHFQHSRRSLVPDLQGIPGAHIPPMYSPHSEMNLYKRNVSGYMSQSASPLIAHHHLPMYSTPIQRDTLAPRNLDFNYSPILVKALTTPSHDLQKSENAPKRPRTSFSKHQVNSLEELFEKQQYVVGDERAQIAQKLKLTESQVKIWFQNRRIKLRKENKSKMAIQAQSSFQIIAKVLQ